MKLATLGAARPERFALFLLSAAAFRVLYYHGNTHDLSDGSAVPHDRYVATLDGHMGFKVGAPLSVTASTPIGLGMTLFFLLSGFVIHQLQFDGQPLRAVSPV